LFNSFIREVLFKPSIEQDFWLQSFVNSVFDSDSEAGIRETTESSYRKLINRCKRWFPLRNVSDDPVKDDLKVLNFTTAIFHLF
jgi:hypothetical protein